MRTTLNIKIFSFGFKYYHNDLPPACDLRIDLRNKMKNPQSHLPKGATGKDRKVVKTILDAEQNKKYIESLLKRVNLKIAETSKENYKIGIGCHSGIHRSVVIADYLSEELEKNGYEVDTTHVHLKSKP